MFEKITPEEAGISSAAVAKYISLCEKHGLATHSILMMRGDKIYAEYYWKPFDANFNHRMYSQTKSYVAVAVGLLVDDGVIDLDKKFVDYFPEAVKDTAREYRKEQTIRHMLTMQTPGCSKNWFTADNPCRNDQYINEEICSAHPTNTIWRYDSSGSQALCTLVEKLTGKSIFDFLYERIFKRLGTFKNAEILKVRTGESWGDSALLCTARDMASFARFVLNYGTWNGERLISESFLRDATSPLVDNSETAWDTPLQQGYGYQIWRCGRDAFAFVGMGDQITVMHPKTDTIFVITSDNQGYPSARIQILNNYLDMIIDEMSDTPLVADKNAEEMLAQVTKDLKLRCVKGIPYHENAEKYNDKVFDATPVGTTGITKFSLHFEEDGGELRYTNKQGDKVLPFTILKNTFCKFPELGYSNDFGGARTNDGFMYDCASSAAWRTDGKFVINVQIIDRYFGNCSFVFGFNENRATIALSKVAEDFLDTYTGTVVGKLTE